MAGGQLSEGARTWLGLHREERRGRTAVAGLAEWPDGLQEGFRVMGRVIGVGYDMGYRVTVMQHKCCLQAFVLLKSQREVTETYIACKPRLWRCRAGRGAQASAD